MIMCVLLCYPLSIHMSQLLSTGRPISSFYSIFTPQPCKAVQVLFTPSYAKPKSFLRVSLKPRGYRKFRLGGTLVWRWRCAVSWFNLDLTLTE